MEHLRESSSFICSTPASQSRPCFKLSTSYDTWQKTKGHASKSWQFTIAAESTYQKASKLVEVSTSLHPRTKSKAKESLQGTPISRHADQVELRTPTEASQKEFSKRPSSFQQGSQSSSSSSLLTGSHYLGRLAKFTRLAERTTYFISNGHLARITKYIQHPVNVRSGGFLQ